MAHAVQYCFDLISCSNPMIQTMSCSIFNVSKTVRAQTQWKRARWDRLQNCPDYDFQIILALGSINTFWNFDELWPSVTKLAPDYKMMLRLQLHIKIPRKEAKYSTDLIQDNFTSQVDVTTKDIHVIIGTNWQLCTNGINTSDLWKKWDSC